MYNCISDIILRNYNPTVAFAAKIFAILRLRKPLKYVKLGKARTKENWHVLRQHKKNITLQLVHYKWDQPSYCEAETTGIVVYLRGL